VLRRRAYQTRALRLTRNLRQAPLIPLLIIALVVFMAIFANVLTVESPTLPSLTDRLQPPFWEEGGSLSHPLGTDPLGRDILTRLMFGARISLLVAFFTLLLGGMGGAMIGLFSGYMGGKIGTIIMRIADATLAFPIILLASTIGASLVNVIYAIAMVLWARYTRIIPGEVLVLKEQDFVAKARVVGCSHFRIMVVYLFPNVVNTLIVLLTLQVGWVIIVEASLSFLGAGVPPPTPAWGSMVSDGRDYIIDAWWVSPFPGLAIMLVVLAFNLLGDWLRDKLDPKLRNVA
jgi:peptide/nickel transport system permease protein